jgi:hypothetical protein
MFPISYLVNAYIGEHPIQSSNHVVNEVDIESKEDVDIESKEDVDIESKEDEVSTPVMSPRELVAPGAPLRVVENTGRRLERSDVFWRELDGVVVREVMERSTDVRQRIEFDTVPNRVWRR